MPQFKSVFSNTLLKGWEPNLKFVPSWKKLLTPLPFEQTLPALSYAINAFGLVVEEPATVVNTTCRSLLFYEYAVKFYY